MSNVLENIKAKASAMNKHVVLPEGEDSRVVKAAAEVVKQGLAKITLLGNPAQIAKNNPDVDLTGVNVVDPVTYEKTTAYAEMLYKAREGKINKKTGLPEYADVDAAKAGVLKDYTMYAALMLKAGDVDGLVSGACHSTANTLRPGLQVIKTAPGINTVSSCFIMVADRENKYNPDGVAVFADCAINIEPDANQLADIAISTAATAKDVAEIDNSYVLGAVMNNPFNRNPLDQLGFAVGLNHINEDAVGEDLEHNWEKVLEGYVTLGVSKWLTVTPDIQVYFDPALSPKSDNAFVFSIRTTVFF